MTEALTQLRRWRATRRSQQQPLPNDAAEPDKQDAAAAVLAATLVLLLPRHHAPSVTRTTGASGQLARAMLQCNACSNAMGGLRWERRRPWHHHRLRLGSSGAGDNADDDDDCQAQVRALAIELGVAALFASRQDSKHSQSADAASPGSHGGCAGERLLLGVGGWVGLPPNRTYHDLTCLLYSYI